MVDVFKEADVYPIVFLATNNKHSNSAVLTKVMKDLSEPMSFNTINSSVFYQDIFWDKYFFAKKIVDLIIRITLNKKLNTLFPYVFAAATVNEAYQIKEIIKDQANHTNNQTYFKFINTVNDNQKLTHRDHRKVTHPGLNLKNTIANVIPARFTSLHYLPFVEFFFFRLSFNL